MIDFQLKTLEKFGYTKRVYDHDDLCDYEKVTDLDGLRVDCFIEIADNENPDNMSYRGVVSLWSPDGKRIAEWDTEKRYKLLDVIWGCERILQLAQGIKKFLDKAKAV